MNELFEIPYVFEMCILAVLTNCFWYAAKFFLKSKGRKMSFLRDHFSDFKELYIVAKSSEKTLDKLIAYGALFTLGTCSVAFIYLAYLTMVAFTN